MSSALYHVTDSTAVRETRMARVQEVCCVCGAVEGIGTLLPHVREGEVWFCAGCRGGLPPDEVAHVLQEVALRGVPLS